MNLLKSIEAKAGVLLPIPGVRERGVRATLDGTVFRKIVGTCVSVANAKTGLANRDAKPITIMAGRAGRCDFHGF